MSQSPYPYDDVAAKCYTHLSHSQMLMQSMRHVWFDAFAFVRGDQWGFWDSGLGRMRQRPALPWKQRITDNQTLALIQQQLGIVLEKQPTYTAFPFTDDDEDRNAAFGAEGLLRYHWDRLDLTDEFERVANSSLISGNGFWRTDWDAGQGESVLVPLPPGSSLIGAPDAPKLEDGAENAVVLPTGEVLDDAVPVGDISVRYVSPFAMNVDPAATSLKDARWVAQESYVHIDVLKDMLGAEAVKSLNPDVEGSGFLAYELAQRADQSIMALGDVRYLVRVVEFWEAPNRDNPNGKVYTLANGRTLDAKDNPYEGRYPYMHLPCIKVDGSFWAEGFVKHLRPLAVLNNRMLSRYVEIANLMGNPKYVADKLAGLKETALNDRPGEVVTINPGGQLTALPAPPPPTIHPQIMAQAVGSLQTISGVNDPLMGNNAPNVRSGRSLAFLQEGALRRFIPFSLHIESFLRQTGRMELYLMQKFYTEDRTIRILGPNNEPQVKAISSTDLSRVSDVTIAPGSMLPASKAAKQDLMMDLVQNAPALLMDDTGRPDKARIFRVLDMPSVTGRQDPDDADRQRAQREHDLLRQGQQVPVSPWENHAVHQAEHKRELLSARVDSKPDYKAALAAHWQAHAAAAAPAAPSPMAGGPGGASPATPPGSPPLASNPLLAGFLQSKGLGGMGVQPGQQPDQDQGEPGAENMLGPRQDMPGGSR